MTGQNATNAVQVKKNMGKLSGGALQVGTGLVSRAANLGVNPTVLIAPFL